MRFLLTFAIILAIIVFSLIFFRGGDGPDSEINQVTLSSLAASNAKVRFTVDGPINAREEHRSVVFEIGRDIREVTITRGYEGRVLKTQRLANSQEAYEVFLNAIERYGYDKIKTRVSENEKGACPTGHRYIYEVIDSAESDSRSWSTSCRGLGNFGGNNPATIRNLFKDQIPDYREFIEGVQGVQV